MYKLSEEKMNRKLERFKKYNNKSNLAKTILSHVENNKKEYLMCIVLFFLGIILSIFFINNCNENQVYEINVYINNLISNLKKLRDVNYIELFFDSMKLNVLIIIYVFISSLIVIGKPILYSFIIGKGFILGYTISSIINTLGISNGLITSISGLLIHHIIFIPTFFALCIRGIGVYSNIIRDKKIVKIEFMQYIIFLLLILLLFAISSLIEVFVSYSFMIYILQYLNI